MCSALIFHLFFLGNRIWFNIRSFPKVLCLKLPSNSQTTVAFILNSEQKTLSVYWFIFYDYYFVSINWCSELRQVYREQRNVIKFACGRENIFFSQWLYSPIQLRIAQICTETLKVYEWMVVLKPIMVLFYIALWTISGEYSCYTNLTWDIYRWNNIYRLALTEVRFVRVEKDNIK